MSVKPDQVHLTGVNLYVYDTRTGALALVYDNSADPDNKLCRPFNGEFRSADAVHWWTEQDGTSKQAVNLKAI